MLAILSCSRPLVVASVLDTRETQKIHTHVSRPRRYIRTCLKSGSSKRLRPITKKRAMQYLKYERCNGWRARARRQSIISRFLIQRRADGGANETRRLISIHVVEKERYHALRISESRARSHWEKYSSISQAGSHWPNTIRRGQGHIGSRLLHDLLKVRACRPSSGRRRGR